MSFNGINVNHIRGGARTYPPTSLVGCVCHPLPELTLPVREQLWLYPHRGFCLFMLRH